MIMTSEIKLINKLKMDNKLTREDWINILSSRSAEGLKYLQSEAREIANKSYGNKVFIRGLIEISNYCKNDCYYCGINRSNLNVSRYRLNKEEILSCCDNGYSLGFRTFVMQGGEDPYLSDEVLCDIVRDIHEKYPDCAITLSVGERSYESYKKLYEAGAERYLLRHETACDEHYRKLHPDNQKLSNRIQCLNSLKDIGYQVGAGFMVGSPYQTVETLAEDMMFISEFKPHMVGIGPFIPHHDTVFKDEPAGDVELTLYLIGLIRLLLPNANIPATTALGTISDDGRQQGILSGANVIMPNLSPKEVREKYELYNNKLSTGVESAEGLDLLKEKIQEIGYEIVVDKGDYKWD